MSRWAVLLAALVATGCADAEGETCEPADMPDTPTLESPGSDAVFSDALVLRSSEFTDSAGDRHASSEFEIRYPSRSEDEPGDLVWSAAVTDTAKLLEVILADGQFHVGSKLVDRTNYMARVRHQDTGERCNWSEWSDGQEFGTDESRYIFDPGQILTFKIEIPQESWDLINDQAVAPGCEQYSRDYYRGNLRFEGRLIEGVGVRAKGGCGSSRDLNGKAAFKIKLDWDDPNVPGCGPDRELYGLDALTLNNGVQDPSATHERMAHRFYREAGVPAPRVAHARVHINGEYWGLYIHVETINRKFLRRWFEHPKGMMYEGAYWCDLLEGNLPATDEGKTCFQREFVHDECDGAIDTDDDPKDWELLRDWTQKLAMLPPGEPYPALESLLDFDTFLTMMAIEAVIAHWDGYPWELNNNYRAYHDPVLDGWTLLPWGLDQAFVEHDFDPWRSATGIISRPCLEQSQCAALFFARLEEMTEMFEHLDFPAEARAIRDQILEHVAEDPRKEYDMPGWENEVERTLDFLSTRAARVRLLLEEHAD